MYRRKFVSYCFVLVSCVLFSIWQDCFTVSLAAAEPTEYTETFTYKEMAALILSSTVTYRLDFAPVDGKPDFISGNVKPRLVPVPIDVELYEPSANFIEIPISLPADRSLNSYSVVFELPFVVKDCIDFYLAFVPCSYSSTNEYSITNYNSIIQFDNNSSVVYSSNFSFSSRVQSILSFKDDYNRFVRTRFGINGEQQKLYFSYTSANNQQGTCSYFKSISPDYSLSYPTVPTVPFPISYNDVSSFGMTLSYANSSLLTNSSLGFIIAPIKITYAKGGGYSPANPDPEPDKPDPDSDPDPDKPDPKPDPEPSNGEYAEKLDEIYQKLIAQGIISEIQNQQIIQGQKDIVQGQKDQIDNDNKLWEDTFDPSEEAVGELGSSIDDSSSELEEKLGFFSFLDEFLQGIVDLFDVDIGENEFPVLEIPELSFDMPNDNGNVQIWQPFNVDLADFLSGFSTLLSAVKFFTSTIMIFSFIHYCYTWLHGLLNSWNMEMLEVALEKDL